MQEVIGAHLEQTLINKAVIELLKYESKQKEKNEASTLLGSYSKPILAQVHLFNVIKNPIVRPIRVKIPNSFFSVDTEDHRICLFCKTEDKEKIEELLIANPISGLSKVISISDVRKIYSAFKDRKQLLSEYTHFVTDATIMQHIYNLLGKVFSNRNNYPVPITYTSVSKLPAAIVKATESSYMHVKGQNISIRLGHSGMKASDIVSNICSGVEFAVSKLPQAWKSVHSIHLKSSDSPALPVYCKTASDTLSFVKAKTAESKDNVSEDKPVKGKSSKKKRKAKSDELAGATKLKIGKLKSKVKSTPE